MKLSMTDLMAMLEVGDAPPALRRLNACSHPHRLQLLLPPITSQGPAATADAGARVSAGRK